MPLNNKEITYLGVDLGGTKMLVGEMTPEGKLLRWKKYPTGPLGQRQSLELIQRCVEDYLETARPQDAPPPVAMGVGLVGRIDSERGLWMEIDPGRSTQLPVGAILSEKFKMPCFIANDVHSATKAEMLFGEGRKSKNLIYINVGTGIAAGIVVNGQLISGGHCNAGEVGHTASGIELHVPCVCGRQDCVEPVASGLGFDKCARLLEPSYPDTLLPIPRDGSRVQVAQVFTLYGRDALCTRLTDNAAQAIANLVMNLVRTTDPDTVILGGGVMSDEFLFPRVLEKIDPYTTRFVTNGIVLTSLAPASIGLMGACSNAILGMGHTPPRKG
ncbi:MAG: ROK family protein [Eubacteriales bacterium]|nr:ROK family protein [Eubacteriales bacterium]